MPFLAEDATPPTKGKGSKLSVKMRLFVDEFMVDQVGSKAVIRAGYKTDNPNRIASSLLRHPLVKAEIDKRLAERREKNEVTVDYVIQKLQTIVEDTEKGNPQAALRGLELLGKQLGMFKERTEISGPDGEAIKYEKVREDADDFTRAIAGLAKRARPNNVVELPNSGTEG